MSMRIWMYAGLSLLLGFAFFFSYLPHIEYKFPIHVDEWQAIHDAQSLEDGTYTGGLTALRFGFHFFLSALPIDLVYTYHLLPAIWCMISALIFYLILKKRLGIPWAIVAGFLFITIKSNNATLGHWFFTPLTFSIPFVMLLHYLYLNFIENYETKYIVGILLICFVLLFTYPIALIFYSIVVFFSFSWISILKKKKYLLFFILPPLVILCFSLFFITLRQNPLNIILDVGLISTHWFNVLHLTHPNQILTWLAIVTTVIGIGFVLWSSKLRTQYVHEISWLSTGIVWIILAYTTNYSLFVPLERVIYFTAIITPIFGALGIQELSKRIPRKYFTYTVGLLIIAGIIYVPFFFLDYSLSDSGRELYYAATEDEINFINYVNLSSSHIVLTPSYTSLVFLTLTPAQPVIVLPFVKNNELLESVVAFYQPLPCEIKNNILQSIVNAKNITHIYSPKEISCGSFNLVASSNTSYLYAYTI